MKLADLLVTGEDAPPCGPPPIDPASSPCAAAADPMSPARLTYFCGGRAKRRRFRPGNLRRICSLRTGMGGNRPCCCWCWRGCWCCCFGGLSSPAEAFKRLLVLLLMSWIWPVPRVLRTVLLGEPGEERLARSLTQVGLTFNLDSRLLREAWNYKIFLTFSIQES